MQTYTIHAKKRAKALKAHFKSEIKKSKGFVRFCYFLTNVFKVLAVVLGTANIVYCALWSRYPDIELMLLLVTAVLPYALSYIPNAVCTTSVSSEYRIRTRETVCLMDEGFSYSFQTLLSTMALTFDVRYQSIQSVEYDPKTKIITIRGPIACGTYQNGERTETDALSEVSFFNAYDIDIYELLKSKR